MTSHPVPERSTQDPMASKAPQKAPAKASKPKAKPAHSQPANLLTGDPSATSSKPKSAKAGDAKKAAGSAPAAPKAGLRPAPAGRQRPLVVPRGMASIDDGDVLMAHGGGGAGFGRCGGRLLSSNLEQQLCHKLGIAGVVHSHSPRHYEVKYEDGKVAAYAPMVVLRGRGREGKCVVIEAVEDPNTPMLRKIIAFRSQYGAEFYMILVATDEVLDEISVTAYDESCSSTNVNTLIARLAE